MAEDAGECELVSAADSLIYRESTGKSPKPGLCDRRELGEELLPTAQTTHFPSFENRESSAQGQGTPRPPDAELGGRGREPAANT